MSRQVHHRFRGTLQAPGAARDALVSALSDAYTDLPPLAAADAVVVVSELVTNAMRAGAEQIDVAYVLNEQDLVIRVTDDAPGLPVRQVAGVLDTTGRGLQLVEALARTWRTVPRAAVGKSVQASIAFDPAVDSPSTQI